LSGVWKKTEIKGCKIIDYVNCISSVVTNPLGGCFGLVEIMSKESISEKSACYKDNTVSESSDKHLTKCLPSLFN